MTSRLEPRHMLRLFRSDGRVLLGGTAKMSKHAALAKAIPAPSLPVSSVTLANFLA